MVNLTYLMNLGYLANLVYLENFEYLVSLDYMVNPLNLVFLVTRSTCFTWPDW